MDFSTILGLLLGVFLIALSIASELSSFWDLSSVYITIGGMIAAMMVYFPFVELRKIPALLKIAFGKAEFSSSEIIELLVSFAEVSRREGLLALEEKAQEVDDEFLQRGIQLVVDGTDPELVRNILEIELIYLEERHSAGQNIFEQMGAIAPAFGMIGTLIGLVLMLQKLDDASTLGTGMAVALTTTFYGALLANLVFLPIAGKLRIKSAAEILRKEIMIEGILSIRAGENPRIVEEKLKAFVPRTSSRANRDIQDMSVGGIGSNA